MSNSLDPDQACQIVITVALTSDLVNNQLFQNMVMLHIKLKGM